MTVYVGLLRGVNVGVRRKIAMADLRAVLAGLGHTRVTTLLQSGNAVFTAPDSAGGEDAVAAAVEERLRAELDLDADVIVRTAAHLRRVVDGIPFDVRDPAKCAVCFLKEPPDPDRLAAIDPDAFAPEEMVPGERELYLYFPDGLGRAKLTPLLARRLGTPATVRNWNTTTRLLALAEG
ncbi:DUF1697 domain-containing protein [Nocardiopsis mangrovi]|uniref:DUF1697 domain-containing protein n=1 Tax=Nocardiopsis mangrovi TaxID=1179818 RepID=A0ABV9E4I5_9ACTN